MDAELTADANGNGKRTAVVRLRRTRRAMQAAQAAGTGEAQTTEGDPARPPAATAVGTSKSKSGRRAHVQSLLCQTPTSTQKISGATFAFRPAWDTGVELECTPVEALSPQHQPSSQSHSPIAATAASASGSASLAFQSVHAPEYREEA